MENVSKALVMAGATLLAVLLISLFMWFLNALRDYNSANVVQQNSISNEKINRYFVYAADYGSVISGVDAYNLFNKAYDINLSFPEYEIEIPSVDIGGKSFSSNTSLENYLSNINSIWNDETILKSLINSKYQYYYYLNEVGRVSKIELIKK